jgi:hypothetical protein
VRSQLPAEILEPIIQRFDPNQLPIVSLPRRPSSLRRSSQTCGSGDREQLRAIARRGAGERRRDRRRLNINVRTNDLSRFGVGIDQV